MSFNNVAIYPFPAVQYIPLSITELEQGNIPKLNPKTKLPLLLAGKKLTEWLTILVQDYGLTIPSSFSLGTCPILALNLKTTDVKYRSFYLTMLGTENPGFYQLFTIPTDRLYKDKIYFSLFDEKTGKLHANCSLFMPASKL